MWAMYLIHLLVSERIYWRKAECNRVVGSMSQLSTSDITDIVLIITILKYPDKRNRNMAYYTVIHTILGLCLDKVRLECVWESQWWLYQEITRK